MAAETPKAGGTVRQDAPVSDAENGAARERLSRPLARPEPDEANSIRARRVRVRTGQEPRAGAPSPAKRESDPKSAPETQSPAATAAKPSVSPGSGSADPWALPQSVRDRFVQDKRRFYFPDGAPAFRDHGKRLTTGSENTEVVRSLVEIARTRGWEEITVDGTERFRREAWRQGRLAGLDVRGYKPPAPERAAMVRRARARPMAHRWSFKSLGAGWNQNRP